MKVRHIASLVYRGEVRKDDQTGIPRHMDIGSRMNERERCIKTSHLMYFQKSCCKGQDSRQASTAADLYVRACGHANNLIYRIEGSRRKNSGKGRSGCNNETDVLSRRAGRGVWAAKHQVVDTGGVHACALPRNQPDACRLVCACKLLPKP